MRCAVRELPSPKDLARATATCPFLTVVGSNPTSAPNSFPPLPDTRRNAFNRLPPKPALGRDIERPLVPAIAIHVDGAWTAEHPEIPTKPGYNALHLSILIVSKLIHIDHSETMIAATAMMRVTTRIGFSFSGSGIRSVVFESDGAHDDKRCRQYEPNPVVEFVEVIDHARLSSWFLVRDSNPNCADQNRVSCH